MLWKIGEKGTNKQSNKSVLNIVSRKKEKNFKSHDWCIELIRNN